MFKSRAYVFRRIFYMFKFGLSHMHMSFIEFAQLLSRLHPMMMIDPTCTAIASPIFGCKVVIHTYLVELVSV